MGTRFSAPGATALPPVGTGQANVGFKPTAEQDAVLEAAKTDRVLIVEALAGTGKTSTLRLLAASRPTTAAYLAYNKSVAIEARSKFPNWVHVSTAHSMAYQATGRAYAHRLPGNGSSRRIFARDLAKLLDIRGGKVGDRQLSNTTVTKIAEATVNRFCLSADIQVGLQHVPAHVLQFHNDWQALAALVVPAAEKIWNDIRNVNGKAYFNHDHYLKIWQTTGPKLSFDCVMFDEAQDANPATAAIVAGQQHAQCVYVGDQNQQMYGWRGAVDAMSQVDGTRLALTKSFRFGPSIANVANDWLDLLGSKHFVQGYEAIPSVIGKLGDSPNTVPNALLCRTNAGALTAIRSFQECGIRVAMAPGDASAGRDLSRFAYAARDLMAGRPTDHPDLVGFESWMDVLEYASEEANGSDLGRLVAIVNRIGPTAVIAAVRNLTPGDRADIMVSTAHKAKGLEWDKVQISSDYERQPDSELSSPDLRAMQMVAYVSVTRAKRVLDLGPLSPADWAC